MVTQALSPASSALHHRGRPPTNPSQKSRSKFERNSVAAAFPIGGHMLRHLFALAALSLPALAQVIIIDNHWPRLPMPLPHPVPVRTDCRIRSVDVRADIQDQAAKIRLTQIFANPSSVPMEAQAYFPVPE